MTYRLFRWQESSETRGSGMSGTLEASEERSAAAPPERAFTYLDSSAITIEATGLQGPSRQPL